VWYARGFNGAAPVTPAIGAWPSGAGRSSGASMGWAPPALAVCVAAPIAALMGLDPPAVLHRPFIQGGGLVLATLGVATFAAQMALGASWRVGVDASERTALVTSGVFGLVRNPIFTAMITTFAGLALMVPNVIALTGLAALLIGVQLQVRLEEEPHLRRLHGEAYRRHTATVGRFVPGIGRHG